MRVLWIVNTIFPVPSEVLGLPSPVIGGWMYGLAEQLSKQNGIALAVATTYNGQEIKKIVRGGIEYFLLPCKNNTKYDNRLELFWKNVCIEFKPSIVHIHGTEYAHGLACMRKLPYLHYVISIQGLLSVISRYYYSGISFWDIFRNITFRDLLKMDTVFQQKYKFKARGIFEKEYIKKARHVIGRTSWDLAHTININSNINYHFCNESLRDSFYSAEKWSFEKCALHTVFLSQAGYPIKGLHQVLKAISILKKDYPNLKVRIGGSNLINSNTFFDRIKYTGYAKFVKDLLKKYELVDNVIFLGSLSEMQMIEEYQSANIFICPSSIENSPNSVGEAQLIGTPVIASYVGGIPDMIIHGKSGLLYRFEEIEMLVENIKMLFNNPTLAKNLSILGIKMATSRHNRQLNLDTLVTIYNSINEKYCGFY
jgi:glycosyltransferase involved in cell wall biosynthesis